MYLEIYNNHPQAKTFIKNVKKHAKQQGRKLEIRVYDSTTYVELERKYIYFFSVISHDVVHKCLNGRLQSYPIEMFGTIYEM